MIVFVSLKHLVFLQQAGGFFLPLSVGNIDIVLTVIGFSEGVKLGELIVRTSNSLLLEVTPPECV